MITLMRYVDWNLGFTGIENQYGLVVSGVLTRIIGVSRLA